MDFIVLMFRLPFLWPFAHLNEHKPGDAFWQEWAREETSCHMFFSHRILSLWSKFAFSMSLPLYGKYGCSSGAFFAPFLKHCIVWQIIDKISCTGRGAWVKINQNSAWVWLLFSKWHCCSSAGDQWREVWFEPQTALRSFKVLQPIHNPTEGGGGWRPSIKNMVKLELAFWCFVLDLAWLFHVWFFVCI